MGEDYPRMSLCSCGLPLRPVFPQMLQILLDWSQQAYRTFVDFRESLLRRFQTNQICHLNCRNVWRSQKEQPHYSLRLMKHKAVIRNSRGHLRFVKGQRILVMFGKINAAFVATKFIHDMTINVKNAA